MYSVQELRLHLLLTELHSVEFILTSLVPSFFFSVHFSAELRSTNLSTDLFLHLQFLFCKQVPTNF